MTDLATIYAAVAAEYGFAPNQVIKSTHRPPGIFTPRQVAAAHIARTHWHTVAAIAAYTRLPPALVRDQAERGYHVAQTDARAMRAIRAVGPAPETGRAIVYVGHYPTHSSAATPRSAITLPAMPWGAAHG